MRSSSDPDAVVLRGYLGRQSRLAAGPVAGPSPVRLEDRHRRAGGFGMLGWGLLVLLIAAVVMRSPRFHVRHRFPEPPAPPTAGSSGPKRRVSHPVAALRDVTLQLERKNMYAVYVGLEDEHGQATTADVKVRVELFQSTPSWSEEKGAFVDIRRLLIQDVRDFSADEFREVALGDGAFRHTALVVRASEFWLDIARFPSSSAYVLKVTLLGEGQPVLESEIPAKLEPGT